MAAVVGEAQSHGAQTYTLSRESAGERLGEELQRQAAGRVPEEASLSLLGCVGC